VKIELVLSQLNSRMIRALRAEVLGREIEREKEKKKIEKEEN
jgi:hypothetical protein